MKIKIISAFIITAFCLTAQTLPKDYGIGKSLLKADSSEPVGNSVIDIIALGDTVILGTGKGLSISRNGGVDWQNYYGSNSFGNEDISAIALYGNEVWSATAHSVEKSGETLPEGSGYRYSSDGGITWTSIAQPLDNQNDTVVSYGKNKIKALPVTVSIQNLTYDLAINKSGIWAASFAGGLRRSTDSGKNWQRIVLPPDYLSEITPDSSYSFSLSPVAGKFSKESNLNHRLFSVIAPYDSLIVAGTAAGINISTDTGKSWKKYNFTNGITGNFIVALAFDKASESLWAASWQAEGTNEYNGISATFDLGQSWKTFLPGKKIHNISTAYDEAKGISFIIAAGTDGLFVTTDNGRSWTEAGIINPDGFVPEYGQIRYYSSAVSSLSPDIVWAGTSSFGVMKFSGNAENWSGNWKSFFSSVKIESADKPIAFPNPFAPKQGRINIKFKAANTSSTATLRIFDFGMNLVRTVVQNYPITPGTDVLLSWDGLNDSGAEIANGVYFFRVDNGDDISYGKILVIK